MRNNEQHAAALAGRMAIERPDLDVVFIRQHIIPGEVTPPPTLRFDVLRSTPGPGGTFVIGPSGAAYDAVTGEEVP